MESKPENVTALSRAWSAGNQAALDELMPVLHRELKLIARRCMRNERKEHTLQPSALVNEAFLRLVDAQGIQWGDRSHFYALAAQVMRRVLVNYAIARGAGKRGGGAQKVELDEAMIASPQRDAQMLSLDEALHAMAKVEPRMVKMVELRFFAGLSVEETAAILEVSPQTVHRDWKLAKTWLAREMAHAAGT